PLGQCGHGGSLLGAAPPGRAAGCCGRGGRRRGGRGGGPPCSGGGGPARSARREGPHSSDDLFNGCGAILPRRPLAGRNQQAIVDVRDHHVLAPLAHRLTGRLSGSAHVDRYVVTAIDDLIALVEQRVTDDGRRRTCGRARRKQREQRQETFAHNKPPGSMTTEWPMRSCARTSPGTADRGFHYLHELARNSSSDRLNGR